MKLMEEDVKKNSILLYEKEMVGDIQGLISNVSGQCKCEVDHLPNIQVLVLSYKNARSAQQPNYFKLLFFMVNLFWVGKLITSN